MYFCLCADPLSSKPIRQKVDKLPDDISRTPLNQIHWWNGGITRDDFQARNVLFQQEDQATYIKKLLEKCLQENMASLI
ncbi:MAG: hypothetical protein D6676_06075 [Cyanobacteria bacterium J003]|nr:MAG: hypothetical protein D6676_06075 [Cyanobacteria bacterium J003]